MSAKPDLRTKLKRKTTDDEAAPPSTKSTRATPGLLTELRQWRFARKLVKVFVEYGDGHFYHTQEKSLSEATNVFERWLLSFQLDYDKSMDSRYPLFPQSLNPEDPVNVKLMDECIEKKFSSSKHNARCIFDELDKRLCTFLQERRSDEQDEDEARNLRVELVEGDSDEAYVQLDTFKSKQCWRVKFLVRNFGLLPAARMLMRYEALGTGSLQWGDPITVHNALHDLMGVRYEGFASPLNSKIIDKEDSRFCSLFIDTDQVFGSMGSFFKVDFDTCNGGWTVNPPFIEELMDRVARKILAYLDGGGKKNWFFVTFPRWTDTPGWSRLSKSARLIDKIELDDGRFAVQDSYGRVFPPRNNLTIFVLGHSLPEGSSLQDIKDAFKNMDLGSVQQEWQDTCRTVLKPERRAARAPPGAVGAAAAAAKAAGLPAIPAAATAPPIDAPAAPATPAAVPADTRVLPAAPFVPPEPLPKNRQLKIAKRTV